MVSYDVESIRAHLADPMTVASALGLVDGHGSIKRLSNGLLARCVWHSERTPSMSITRGPDGTLRVHCFSCDNGGDVFSLIAEVNRLDVHREFGAVVSVAAMVAGLEETGSFSIPAPPPMPPESPRLGDDGFAALAEVIERECPLSSQPDVCRYLASRGLLEAAGSTLWALPGDDRGLERVRQAVIATVGLEAWQTSGMALKSGEWAWSRHRLCIPWRAPDSSVLTLQRRLISAGKPKYVFPARRKTRYPFGVEDFVDSLGPATEIAFTESALDCIALRHISAQLGLDRFVMGLPSCNDWSKPWARLAEGRQVVLALDNDKAGDDGSSRITQDLLDACVLRVRREVPGQGSKDWADLAMRMAS